MRGRLATLISIVLIVGGFVGILYPALIDEKIGITQILVSLAHPEWTQAYVMRWVLVGALACGIYIVILSYITRNRPVTVISANVKINVNNSDWSETEIIGEFVLRANHPNVTSYTSTHTADNGELLIGSMSAQAFCESLDLKSTVELTRMGEKSIEMLQLFGRKLPSHWYMHLIPSYFLTRPYDSLPHFLRARLVKRTTKVRYLYEHSVDLPSARFQAPNYRFMAIHISLQFPADALPNELKARRERNNALVDIPIEKHEPIYHIRVNRLVRSEVIRISWRPDMSKRPASPVVRQ